MYMYITNHVNTIMEQVELYMYVNAICSDMIFLYNVDSPDGRTSPGSCNAKATVQYVGWTL